MRVDQIVPTDAERTFFEDKVFNRRFIAGISKKGEGQFSFTVDCPFKDELCARHPERPDDYKDEAVSAMWFGYRLGLLRERMTT